MIQLQDLPIELLERITLFYSDLCLTMLQVFRYGVHFNQKFLKQYFTKIIKTTYCIAYGLPNGKFHRDDEPALIFKHGVQYWYQNGYLHRDNDLPAIIYPNGIQEWYQNGKRHRDGDQPALIFPSGNQEWWQNDIFIKKNY